MLHQGLAQGQSGGGTSGSAAAAHHVSRDVSPAGLAMARAKRDAWLMCRGMRRRDAMRAFVLLMDACMPAWDA
jgi:hypothetical protein